MVSQPLVIGPPLLIALLTAGVSTAESVPARTVQVAASQVHASDAVGNVPGAVAQPRLDTGSAPGALGAGYGAGARGSGARVSLPQRSSNPGGAPDLLKDLSYVFTIRSAGVEGYVQIPRETHQDAGFSYVDLIHDLDQPQGHCETFGGAYWLGEEVEEGVLGFGAAPTDAGTVSGGYHNPFVSRDVNPNLSPDENLSARHPEVGNPFPPGQELLALPADGPGYRWHAKCGDDTHGAGEGYETDAAGFEAVGSTSAGGVDRSTGTYVGTSRAYVLGSKDAAGFDSASSFMQITARPNQPPTITYRMSYFNAGNTSEKNGITFGGTDIPVQEFAEAFNEQAAAATKVLGGLGPLGAATLVPEQSVSTDGNRYSVTISAGHGNAGLAERDGSLGGNQGARIGAITFECLYSPKR